MASAPRVTGQFDFSRVFSRTFAMIGDHWRVLLVIGLGVALANAALQAAMLGSMLGALDAAQPLAIFSAPGYWGTVLGSWLIGAFACSAMLSVLVGNAEGIGGAVSGGLKGVVPMAALTILWVIGVGIGWMLLVVPGLILLTMWSVSAPALIAERIGIIDAFGRSRALTKGIRWRVFGTLVLFGLVYFVALSVVSGASGFGFGNAAALASAERGSLMLGTVVTAILGGLLSVAVYAFLAGLYRETVEAKEGGNRDELAEVFA